MSKLNKTLLNLTQSQLSFWISQKLHHGIPLHNVAHTFEITGAINEKVFETAFQELLNRTDVLRAVFTELEGVPYQSFLDTFKFELEKVDFTSANESLVQDWVLKRAKKTFDISRRTFDTALLRIENEKYVWFLNLHHLITDGVTTSLLYTQMNSIYSGIINGDPETSLEPSSYEDYIHFESEQQNNTANEVYRSFWKERIARLKETPELYGSSNYNTNTAADRISIPLGKVLSQRLKELTKNPDIRGWTEDSTLFNIFSALYFIYLHRVSRQKKIAVGAPVHNRTEKKFRRTTGLIIEVLPMVNQLFKNDTFFSVLKRIKSETNVFLKNAKPGIFTSETGRSFNTMLNYIMTRFTSFYGFSMKSKWIHTGHMNSAHQMELHIVDFDDKGEIKLLFDINASILDKEGRNDLPKHFLKLLHAFVDDMHQSIYKIQLVSTTNFKSLFSLGYKTSDPFSSIIKQFEDQVKTTPEAIAVSSENNQLTFEQLDQKAHRLANYLKAQGINKDAIVALHLKRSIEYIVSVLATLKLNVTFIPIPSDQPVGRIKYIISDADCDLILTDSELGENIQGGSIPILELDKRESEIAENEVTNLTTAIHEKDSAYIIYTSGSTGKPKGVSISHGALTNYILWARQYYKTKDPFVFPLFTSIGFDLTLTSTILPLVTGGELVVYKESNQGPDISLMEVLEENRVNSIKLTPSHLALIQDKGNSDSLIRTMIVGGEDFKAKIALSTQKFFGDNLRIFNEYGPTEATVGCIVSLFNNDDVHKDFSVPIGLPIANTWAIVLDDHMNPVPKGVVGSLYIGGAGLSKGYLNLPELSSQKFLENPFRPGEKLYATGDLVRLNLMGNYEYLGREDEQVKLRGFRIELSDIEVNLLKHDQVENSAVVLIKNIEEMSEGIRQEKQIIGYYSGKQKISSKELTNHLKKVLPEYMIPDYFKHIEEFPLTSNGKVDKSALKMLNSKPLGIETLFVAPNGEIEELLATIWKDVLQLEKMGVDDNLIALGGHSLAAIRITSRINKEIEMNFPLNKIFELPTIKEYAKYIEETLTALLDE